MLLTLSLFTWLIGLFASATPSENFLLTGTINGVEDGEVYLSSIENPESAAQTLFLKKGKFEYKFEITSPQLYELKFGDKSLRFYLEASNIIIKASSKDFDFAEVKGGNLNDDFQSLNKKYLIINKQLQSLFAPFYEAQQKNIKAKLDSISKVFVQA